MPGLGVFLLILGLWVHLGAKLSLFRSFGVVAANRGVEVKGLYRIVRHPMYAGYFISHIGFLMCVPSLWNVVLYSICWGLLVLRIYAEEKLLLKSLDYQVYKKRVLYRVIPGLF